MMVTKIQYWSLPCSSPAPTRSESLCYQHRKAALQGNREKSLLMAVKICVYLSIGLPDVIMDGIVYSILRSFMKSIHWEANINTD